MVFRLARQSVVYAIYFGIFVLLYAFISIWGNMMAEGVQHLLYYWNEIKVLLGNPTGASVYASCTAYYLHLLRIDEAIVVGMNGIATILTFWFVSMMTLLGLSVAVKSQMLVARGVQ
jgi:hypothetical protein